MSSLTVLSHNSPSPAGGEPSKTRQSARPGPAATRHKNDTNNLVSCSIPTYSKKIPYLIVLASSNQLYSGTGTALFEWVRFAKDYFDFAICIDNRISLNYKIARDFCRAEDLCFLPCGPQSWGGGADPGNAMAPLHVGSGRWPVVEFVSWANTTVNLDILDSCPPGVHLIYTPHTQPAWTMPNAKHFWALEHGFNRMLSSSHLVCCDSPAEVEAVLQRTPKAKATYIPIGVDTSRFCLGNTHRELRILVIADFNETRKRTDLNLAAIHRLLHRNPACNATLAGRNSDMVKVPTEIAERVELLGFVSATNLLELYQKSSLFLLLSDYEAFGIPIVEALCCGTPVVTTRTREARSLFRDLPGCHLVDNTDNAAVDSAIDKAISNSQYENIGRAAAARFNLEKAFTIKLGAIQKLLSCHPQNGSTREVSSMISSVI